MGELDRTLRLLELVIDLPRPALASADPTPVAETVASVLELLQPYARQRGVALAAEVAERCPAVAFAEDSLRQVLLNLLMNAIDATPRDAAVSRGDARPRGPVELAVCDMGPGIAPELRERVFEPFFSTRGAHHGGIGLAIARNLVEQAGGRIARAHRRRGRRHLRRDAAGGGNELAAERAEGERGAAPSANPPRASPTLRVPARPARRRRNDRSRGARRSGRGARGRRARRARPAARSRRARRSRSTRGR